MCSHLLRYVMSSAVCFSYWRIAVLIIKSCEDKSLLRGYKSAICQHERCLLMKQETYEDETHQSRTEDLKTVWWNSFLWYVEATNSLLHRRHYFTHWGHFAAPLSAPDYDINVIVVVDVVVVLYLNTTTSALSARMIIIYHHYHHIRSCLQVQVTICCCSEKLTW